MAGGQEVTPQDKRNADRLRRYWTGWLGVLVVAAMWLEHVCRLPIGPPDDLS